MQKMPRKTISSTVAALSLTTSGVTINRSYTPLHSCGTRNTKEGGKVKCSTGIGKKPGPSPNSVIATGSRQLPEAIDTIDGESVRCFLRALELQSRHSLGLQRQLSLYDVEAKVQEQVSHCVGELINGLLARFYNRLE